MKLVNKTGYPTKDLRSILCAVHSAEPRGRLKQWKRVTVTVSYRRKGNQSYTGHAYLGGTRCHLSVPPVLFGLDVADFAALWRHEMWHLYGFMHKDYTKDVLYTKPASVAHVNLEKYGPLDENQRRGTIQAVKPETRPKPSKEEMQTEAVTRLLARRKAWLTKKKRAETALRTIDASLRYYSKEGIPEATLHSIAAGPKRKRRR